MNAERIISEHVERKLKNAARNINIYPVNRLPVYECPVCRLNHNHDFHLNFYQQPIQGCNDVGISADDARVIKDVIVHGAKEWLLKCKEQTNCMTARFTINVTYGMISVEIETFYVPDVHRCQDF